MKGEFDFIDGIRRLFPAPEGILGIGDDCAVIPQSTGEDMLVSTDMLVEGTHFLKEDISPYQLGWKGAASNFSDIAAMGGSPVGYFLALSLPHDIEDGWADEFIKGLHDISGKYGFPLLGGDTTASPDRICICITVLGKTISGRGILRSGAKEGDIVCVTGTLGDSAAGLDAILQGRPASALTDKLIRKHYLPEPRMDEGRALAACGGVHSMMDISDGIGSDLRHIMEESGVGIEIDPNLIPVSEELREYCSIYGCDINLFSMAGGEDYELLFTASPEAEAGIKVAHTAIGRVTGTGKLTFKGTDKDYTGFRHF